MSHGRITFIALVALMLVGAGAPAAFASFQGSSSSKGSGTNELLILEAGGATVGCGVSKAPLGKDAWTIEKESPREPAKEGGALVVKAESWSGCAMESKSLKNQSATLGACELELKQAGKEEGAAFSIIKTCVVKSSACELTLEAGENKGLSEAYLGNEGSQLKITPLIKRVKDKTSTGCKEKGIEAGSEGVLTGVMTMTSIEASVAAPEYMMTASRTEFAAGGEATFIEIKKILGPQNSPMSLGRGEFPMSAILPGPNGIGEVNCRVGPYSLNSKCSFRLESNPAFISPFATVFILVAPNNTRAEVTLQNARL